MLGTSRQLRSRGNKSSASNAETGGTAGSKRRAFGDVSNRTQNPADENEDAKPAAKRNSVAVVAPQGRTARSNEASPGPQLPPNNSSLSKKESLRNLIAHIQASKKAAAKTNDTSQTQNATKPELSLADDALKPKKPPAKKKRTLSSRKPAEEQLAPAPAQRTTRSANCESEPEGRRRTRSSSRNKPDDTADVKNISLAGTKRSSSKTKDPAAKKARRLPLEKKSAPASKSKAKKEAKPKQEVESDAKANRGRSRAKSIGRKPKSGAKSVPRELCSDFLGDSNYTLVRVPFDSSKYTAGISKHDEDSKDDPLAVSSYVTDMFQRLYHAEETYKPRMYMEDQDEINSMMRAILIDWLVEVHMKFKLVPETLYLCINIIDRYCSQVEVERRKLQLVGVTALLLACKYEEIYPPEVRDCVYITDRAYTRQDVLDMEQKIVNTLQFKLTVPTAYPFLVRYLQVTKASELTGAAATYYMERTLQDYDFVQHRPSLVAAAAVCLALNNPQVRTAENATGRKPGITEDLVEYTGYAKNDIYTVASKIAERIGAEVVTASQRELLAVKKKYDTRKYFHVSTDVIDPEIDHLL